MNNKKNIIFLATPWGPIGGGMFKVVDYLIQNHDPHTSNVELKHLDTRGNRHAFFSIFYTLIAMVRILISKSRNELLGVHINIAERLSLFRKGVLIIFCKIIGVPTILHLHAAQLHHFYKTLPEPIKGLTRWLFNSSSHCIVLGRNSEAFVRDQLGVPEDKISIVINGVPKANVEHKSKHPDDPFRFLFLGNLSERKGVTDLLRAFADLKKSLQSKRPLILHLAGGGDINHYQKLASELGLSNDVIFEGWCDQQKASTLQSLADVQILPSYDEGLPLVILEALSARLPVICTPVGEIPFVLTHETNALFVEPGNVTDIVNSMKRLISDEELRKKLSDNGAYTYEKEFSIKKFFSNISDLHKLHFGFSAKFRDDRAS